MLHHYSGLTKCINICCLLLLTSLGAYAQSTVSGKITSAIDQSSLQGVTFMVKEPNTGDVFDMADHYPINVPSMDDIYLPKALNHGVH